MPVSLPSVDELIPAPDPWDVARRFADWPRLIFFDSSDRASPFAKSSYVAAAPRQTLDIRVRDARDPFGELRALLPSKAATVPGLPPFQGGVAGLFGYALGRTLERLPEPEYDEFDLPDLAVGVYDWVVSFDHRRNRAWLVSRADAAVTASIRRRLSDGNICQPHHLPQRQVGIRSPRHPLEANPLVETNFARAEYEALVRGAIEAIYDGQCFQVNLSQRLLAPAVEPPLDLYGRLRKVNPAPFAAYAEYGWGQVLSASPERFLALEADGLAATRPIKGTRRRGSSPEEDFALRHDLLASEKDRAENVMIVDLLRNDLSRVCEAGSVVVPTLCELETHPTVHHLVSEVRGRLRSGAGPVDLLRAAFPGGSVTGAPKVRAMELIAQWERVARGPYCGSLGWIGFDGVMDASILIRTMTAAGGWLQFPVGGGIVSDSDPAREYEETLHKAAGLLRALGE